MTNQSGPCPNCESPKGRACDCRTSEVVAAMTSMGLRERQPTGSTVNAPLPSGKRFEVNLPKHTVHLPSAEGLDKGLCSAPLLSEYGITQDIMMVTCPACLFTMLAVLHTQMGQILARSHQLSKGVTAI